MYGIKKENLFFSQTKTAWAAEDIDILKENSACLLNGDNIVSMLCFLLQWGRGVESQLRVVIGDLSLKENAQLCHAVKH